MPPLSASFSDRTVAEFTLPENTENARLPDAANELRVHSSSRAPVADVDATVWTLLDTYGVAVSPPLISSMTIDMRVGAVPCAMVKLFVPDDVASMKITVTRRRFVPDPVYRFVSEPSVEIPVPEQVGVDGFVDVFVSDDTVTG